MTRRVAWFTGNTKHPEAFTPYKVYEVLDERDRTFNIINNKGGRNFCLKEGCAHLNYGDWTLADVVEKEVKPVEAEQPTAVTKKPKKWSGWIKNKTGECPVGLKRKQKVKLKWSDGAEFVIGNPQDASWYFNEGNNSVDITHYKVKLKDQSLDKQEKLKEKKDWTMNTGVMPIDKGVNVRFKRRDGLKYTAISECCDWVLNDKYWNIIKWRLDD